MNVDAKIVLNLNIRTAQQIRANPIQIRAKASTRECVNKRIDGSQPNSNVKHQDNTT